MGSAWAVPSQQSCPGRSGGRTSRNPTVSGWRVAPSSSRRGYITPPRAEPHPPAPHPILVKCRLAARSRPRREHIQRNRARPNRPAASRKVTSEHREPGDAALDAFVSRRLVSAVGNLQSESRFGRMPMRRGMRSAMLQLRSAMLQRSS